MSVPAAPTLSIACVLVYYIQSPHLCPLDFVWLRYKMEMLKRQSNIFKLRSCTGIENQISSNQVFEENESLFSPIHAFILQPCKWQQ
jgi:hypothetical protein